MRGYPVASGRQRYSIISDGLPTQLPDIDPDETREWIDSFDSVTRERGRGGARSLMLRLLERAREQQVGVHGLRSTDYINTIAPESEPWFPGDEYVERRIRAYIRWNAAIMVSRANRPGGAGVGGHIATYASAASLYEVGFNHFFRGKDHGESGDQVFIQGHAAPGIYARAFLEGRLSESQLDGFRQELSHSDGVLVNKMNTTPDGQFQTYSVESGAYIREHFFGGDPRLRKIVEHLSDDELRGLSRGGHDYRKVYAAFKAAREHVGQPTVILTHTIKGWTLGKDFEARNATHQSNNLTVAELKEFRDRLYLPIPDSALEAELPPYYHPGEDSDEVQYMPERRTRPGGGRPP